MEKRAEDHMLQVWIQDKSVHLDRPIVFWCQRYAVVLCDVKRFANAVVVASKRMSRELELLKLAILSNRI